MRALVDELALPLGASDDTHSNHIYLFHLCLNATYHDLTSLPNGYRSCPIGHRL